MNPQETQQVAVLLQKEETFQRVIDLVKNSSCFKAFTISTDIPKIFMQQFWYSIKKVRGINSYEFLLANKKCVVNVDVFRTILDICPRVKGVNFTDVPDDDTTLAFLIKLDTKIDHIKEKRSRRENMPFPRFTKETVGRSKVSEPEPELVKRKISSKERIKKKVTLSPDDNIISDDLDTALELGKSISQTKAEEAEAAKQLHATHARIVKEFILEPTKRRKLGKVTSDPPKKLKGVPSLTLKEQEAADIMVPNESTIISATSSGGTSTKPGVPDEEKEITKENVILEWGSEQESKYSEEDKLNNEEKDDKEGDDDEDDETESDEDDIYKYKIRMLKDEDEEMINADVDNSDKGDKDVTDAAKAYVKKTSEVKNDAKLLPISSSLSMSLGFGDQFLKLSSDSSLVSTVKDTKYAKINSLLKVKIQSEVPHTKKYVSELKKIDLFVEALAALKTQVPSVVDNYLRSKVGDVFQKELKKHIADLFQKYSLQQIFELPKKQTPTTMHANKSFNKNPANHRLYHALMEALIEDENAMDKGVADTVQDHKRKHDHAEDANIKMLQLDQKHTKRRRTKDSESSKKPSTTKETPKGKALSKGSKTGKSASTKEPIKEPITEVVMDDASDDVVHDDDQPQDASEPKTTKTSNPDWFKQPPRTYTTLITKTKAARYEIEGIKDMVPTLCSPTKVGDVVKRADNQFYKFKEGDFVNPHLNDIEDMLLLAVQHKLFHLMDNDIVDFIVALWVINEDLTKQKRVMRADELYKLSDGTFKKVRDELHHRMRERRIIQNLERLIGARELEMDNKLMTRTV
nr:hypothetical protein [Tanacetum cinerariifolium]